MSYILDALRRADAERERGAVPSLHTQQYGALPGDEDEATRRGRLPTVVAAVLAVALLAVLGWHYLGAGEPAPVAVAVVPAPPPVVSAPPVDAMPASGAATMASIASGSGSHPGIGAARPSAPPAASSAAATRRASKREPTTAPATTPPATTSAGDGAAPARQPASAANDRVYAVAELPDEVRRDLPKLAFGGSSYSSDPASRMVILNGQVFHEGDGIVRGVVLQRVNRKSAILAVRGYRFELMF